MFGVGSASILSRALGKGDKETVDKIMGNLIYWVVLFSVIITVGGIFLAPHFLDLVGAEGEKNWDEVFLWRKNIPKQNRYRVFHGSVSKNYAIPSKRVG